MILAEPMARITNRDGTKTFPITTPLCAKAEWMAMPGLAEASIKVETMVEEIMGEAAASAVAGTMIAGVTTATQADTHRAFTSEQSTMNTIVAKSASTVSRGSLEETRNIVGSIKDVLRRIESTTIGSVATIASEPMSDGDMIAPRHSIGVNVASAVDSDLQMQAVNSEVETRGKKSGESRSFR